MVGKYVEAADKGLEQIKTRTDQLYVYYTSPVSIRELPAFQELISR